MTVLVGGGQRKTLAKSQASRFHDGGCGRVDEAVEGFADSRALSSEADRGDSLGCWRKGEDPEPSVVWGFLGPPAHQAPCIELPSGWTGVGCQIDRSAQALAFRFPCLATHTLGIAEGSECADWQRWCICVRVMWEPFPLPTAGPNRLSRWCVV
jgi:hypothetical protein